MSPSPPNHVFPRRLGAALERRPELLVDICRTLATSPEALAGWHVSSRSSGTPSLGELAELCRVTGLSSDWLLGLAGRDDTPVWREDRKPRSAEAYDPDAVRAVADLVRRFSRAIESAEIPPQHKFALMHGLLTTRPKPSPAKTPAHSQENGE